MATEKEILQIDGREVTVTNPRKVYFPETGPHEARPRALLPGRRRRGAARRRWPADGAQAVRGRRRRAAVLPEAGPGQPARLHPDRDADLPVRPDRRRDRHRRRGGARVGRQPRLHRPQPAPGPRRGPRPPRRAAGRPRSGARACRGRTSGEVALATREALEAVGLVGWPKTSGSRGIHINVRIEPRWTYPEVRRAALALARDVERRVPDLATSKWWKEERHGVFLDYNQNAKDRTVASAYSVRPLPDARVSTPLTWDEVPTVEAEAFTLDTVPGALRRDRRPGRRHRRRGRLARGAAGAEPAARGGGPGRRPVAAELRQAGRRAAARPAVEGAPSAVRVRAGARRGRWAAAGGRRGARGRRRRG